jgi:hypothetical protein
MSPQLALFILVALLVVGWFALGTHFNVRKGEAALRWLQEGLPLIGEKTTLRWLGSSAVELKIQQAKPPFRAAEVILLLEPRDVPPLWLLSRLRGRRDLFVFRGTLRSRPDLEFEAFDPGSWSTGDLTRRCNQRNWVHLSGPPPPVVYAPSRTEAVAAILQAAEISGCPLVRLSVRRAEPELEIQWQLSHLCEHPFTAVVQTLKRVAESL